MGAVQTTIWSKKKPLLHSARIQTNNPYGHKPTWVNLIFIEKWMQDVEKNQKIDWYSFEEFIISKNLLIFDDHYEKILKFHNFILNLIMYSRRYTSCVKIFLFL